MDALLQPRTLSMRALVGAKIGTYDSIRDFTCLETKVIHATIGSTREV